MKTSLLYICTLLSALPANGSAQEAKAWTLRQCVDYAIEHNITVKQMDNTRRQQEVQLSTDRNSRLPEISASASQNFSFGRGLTSQNTYENRNTSSTSLQLGASVPLFTGMKIPYAIRLSRLNLEASLADLEKARNDIGMQVAQAYVEILYDIEISEVAHRQIAIDSMQVERLVVMMDNGKASAAQVSQQKATLAQSRLTATTADNNYRLAVLTLTQLLELPSPDGFRIVRPNADDIHPAGSIPATPDAVYNEALTIKPEVKAQQMRVQGADYSIKIARSALYPQLSFSAGMGSNYYKTGGFEADPFFTQMKNNFSQYLGFSLTVPIFSRFATRNSIRTAEIDRDNQRLKLEDVKKTLYKEIQQVYYNAVAADAKYASSREAVASNEDAFTLTRAKYENGKANITEFNETKNNYLKALSDMVQAKYEYLYQTTLLDFYRGRGLDF